jgi:hypothetical protein
VPISLIVLLLVFLLVVAAIAFFVFPAHKIVHWLYKDTKKKP